MSELRIDLHPAQAKVFQHPARFKVVAAGRRFGKTVLARALLTLWSAESGHRKDDLFYISPTFQQARDIMWNDMKKELEPITATTHENTGVLTTSFGSRISLKGSDRPDTLRGVGLRGAVIDEYAEMKPMVFEEIVRPALADERGPALFIGTPKGRNHFYRLAKYAQESGDPEWAYFHFTTYDNPFIDPREIEAAKRSMSSYAFRQEFLASFEAAGGDAFKSEWIRITDKPKEDGYKVVVADLAGFQDLETQRSAAYKNLDSSVIATALVYGSEPKKWIEAIEHGRWTVQETARKLVNACKAAGTHRLGVERGITLQAVYPFLHTESLNLGWAVDLEPLTHGNNRKADRIIWGLQGDLEHGRMTFADGPWMDDVIDQILQFPSRLVHDDIPDALSYVAQVAKGPSIIWTPEDEGRIWTPLDADMGY